jgi:hypothetical protein
MFKKLAFAFIVALSLASTTAAFALPAVQDKASPKAWDYDDYSYDGQ